MKAAVILVMIFAAYAIAGTLDYDIEVGMHAERSPLIAAVSEGVR